MPSACFAVALVLTLSSLDRFEKIFSSYRQRKSLHEDAVKFLFEGHRLKGHETPADVGMEDKDQIDACTRSTVC